MELVLRSIILTVLTSAILVMDSSCNQCSPNSGGLFYQEAWGDWHLIRETRPNTTLTSFKEKQTLQIKLNNDGNGNAVTQEKLFKDSTLVKTLEWDVWDTDCKRKSFVVSYDTNSPIRRKYWLQDNFLFASNYVQMIGNTADTITFQYERVLR